MPSQGDNNRKRPSIYEVAERSGVSISTVSRVINNNGRISGATRKRVKEAIKEVGYITNTAAKSLRMSKSKTVGVIVPDISDGWLSAVVSALEGFLFEKGYSTFICNSARDESKEETYFSTLDAKYVDGIICVAGLSSFPIDVLTRDVALVCIDRRPEGLKTYYSVESDHFEGGYLAATELADAGCRHIAFISRSRKLSTNLLRYEGFRQALLERDMNCDNLLVEIDDRMPSAEASQAGMGKLLDSGCQVDGVFATNDWRALGAISALVDRGLRVPQDVRVVGFDDSAIASAMRPSLTSIRQDIEGIAREATDLLIALMERAILSGSGKRIVLPVKLIRRESSMSVTSAPRANDI
ncbi:transcriptional regulator, LacI family [Coriobacterium glomerans PW2]|uniref:Transcriptional regulator, LacI family n=2 Tax=Coriobacterium TaxID=33870 RepID=F2NBB6_CORGP|nr:transcriptional regulator, LacI family [Coriobacterium glomerans PW2]